MNKKTYQAGERLQFGVHKGEKIDDVIDENPDYVAWAIKDQVIDLSNDLHLMLENQGV